MNKWIIISASLLPMLFIGCTEHSLNGDSPFKEDVLVNFSARYAVDYDIDIVPEDLPELATCDTRAADSAVKMGILGVAATEDDVNADCLYGVTGDSFCTNMFNAEYKGTLPGTLKSMDGLPRVFPIEEKSALAVYAYSPYKENALVVGDTSCYVQLNLVEEYMLNDYCYTGKVFQKKEGFGKDDMINLGFRHAFAKVKLDFSVVYPAEAQAKDLRIDTLQIGISGNGTGLFDLKNGMFYPEASEDSDEGYAFDLYEIMSAVNVNALTATTELFIPPVIALKDVKVVYRRRNSDETITRTVTFENELKYEKGKEYSISITLNVPKELYL